MIELKTTPLDIAGVTHAGKVRTENQDRYASFAVPLGEVCLVADGMGGHQGGARAAELAALWIQTGLSAATAPAADALRAAIQGANANIHAEAKSRPELANMGSTVVLALVQDGQVTVAHVGDSRAYLWREAKLKRLTRDHNLMEPLIESGTLTEEQARHHYQSSVLTKALGPYPEVDPTIGEPFRWEPGDRLLLCSDGLCGYVGDEQIAAVLAAEPDPHRASDQLFALAMEAGGEDNITVQVVGDGRLGPLAAVPLRTPTLSSAGPMAPEPLAPKFHLSRIWLAAAAILVLVGALAAWRFWQSRQQQRQSEMVVVLTEQPGQSVTGAGTSRATTAQPGTPVLVAQAPAMPPQAPSAAPPTSPAHPAATNPKPTAPAGTPAIPPAPAAAAPKPRVVLLCSPQCPVDGPAASVVKSLRADKEIELQAIPIPKATNAGAPQEGAPFVLVRSPAALARASTWAAALGVSANHQPAGERQQILWNQHASADVLVLIPSK